MKYLTTTSFRRDWAALPPEHQTMFREALRTDFLPAVAAGALDGGGEFPGRLRIHQLVGAGNVSSMTWHYRRPDGRATFHVELIDGERYLVWRRIGGHAIYAEP